jgi:hypothetical protein
LGQKEGTEKGRVRKEVEDYFERKKYTFKGFGRFKKGNISTGTGLYVIEIEVEEWSSPTYALVTVSRAYPQGMIVLNPEQITVAVKILIDGLDEAF